jgi:eukaryotic-like serine/threonine-protein kinase
MRHPLERLLEIGTQEGPSLDEALMLFAQLRSMPEEGRAIHHLLARSARARLPDPLLVAVASALMDRGEEKAAAATLAPASSMTALILRADLLERAGDVAGAMVLVERVLLRDIDWPGARERHVRWRAAVGRAPILAKPAAGAAWMKDRAEAPFRLVREVARGGAGVVYEAEDRDLERRLALKVYHRPDRDRAQLLHEAQVAVALAAEGIVRVFDVDPDHGWLALEWAPLGALQGQLQRAESWSRNDAWGWILPLARSLAWVHSAGWVHHDVKPANVLLRAPDAPVLSDFGTARPFGAPCPPGSLGYVSPERIAGRPSDPSDDVYAFGRVLEDALGGPADAEGDLAASCRQLAAACTGPADLRPRDGAELTLRLERMPATRGRR